MKKIINALLAVKFPDANIEALLEVVEATPNPTVATEILCGLYEDVELPKYSIPRYNNGRIATLKSFDKWEGKGKYVYEDKVTKGGYFPKTVDRVSITIDNFKSLQAADSMRSDEKIYHHIPTGETKIATSSCSLSDWLDGVDKVDQSTGLPSIPSKGKSK